jgi:hypothetical protein
MMKSNAASHRSARRTRAKVRATLARSLGCSLQALADPVYVVHDDVDGLNPATPITL